VKVFAAALRLIFLKMYLLFFQNRRNEHKESDITLAEKHGSTVFFL
jgi:hypothetical protein